MNNMDNMDLTDNNENMLQDFKEFEGKTVEKATENACEHFGVSENEIDIEILTRGSTGLFGLGGRKAKIKARLKPGAVSPTVHSQSTSDDTTHDNTEKTEAIPSNNSEEPYIKSSQEKQFHEHENKKSDYKPYQYNNDNEDNFYNKSNIITEEHVETARTFITELMAKAGLSPDIKVEEYHNRISIELTGEDISIIIGREGQTLDAIEYMIRRMMVKKLGCIVKLTIDAGGYRAKREQSLSQIARKNASRAKRTGKPVTMNPMGPRDRRTVHIALRSFHGVRTKSIGDGDMKKIVILPLRRQNYNRHSYNKRY